MYEVHYIELILAGWWHGVDQCSYFTSGLVSTWMGDRLHR